MVILAATAVAYIAVHRAMHNPGPAFFASPANNPPLSPPPGQGQEATLDATGQAQQQIQSGIPSQKAIVYDNNQYCFSLTFPDSWSALTSQQLPQKEKAAAGVSPDGEVIIFGLPGQSGLFSIDIYPKDKQQKVLSGTSSFLGENEKYIFSSLIPHWAESADTSNKLADVDSILHTFSTSPQHCK